MTFGTVVSVVVATFFEYNVLFFYIGIPIVRNSDLESEFNAKGFSITFKVVVLKNCYTP